ncbi:MAG TPA: CHAT domain-containing protein [Herpetosiphonaceae bacterium]
MLNKGQPTHQRMHERNGTESVLPGATTSFAGSSASGFQHPIDTIQIQIRPARSDPDTYQFTLFQPGLSVMRGPSRLCRLITDADIQAIRHEVEAEIQLFHQLAALSMATAPLDLKNLLALGRRIAGLLPAAAQQRLAESVRRAKQLRRALKILLEVAPDAGHLLAVPWELLVLPVAEGDADAGGEFLLLNYDIALVRQVQSIGHNTAPMIDTPLTVQAFIAAPIDGQPIDIERTRTALMAALSKEAAARSWYAGPATLMKLNERLRTAQPQILHLLCHGDQQDTGYGLRNDLLFTHQDGLVHRVSAFDLAPTLTLAPSLQLVVLQACYSGSIPLLDHSHSDDRPERSALESIALSLVRQGIPAVIAMQGPVGQDAAGVFVQRLYEVLAEGGSLERAVAVGRIAMQATNAWIDWSLPVVYQGSGYVDVSTWYTRLADRAHAAIGDQAVQRTIRSSLIVWAVLLLIVGVTRWLANRGAQVLEPTVLLLPLQIWACAACIIPSIVAVMQRDMRRRASLTPALHRAVVYTQWVGAYLGYALGGLIGLLALATLWILGLFSIMPEPLAWTLFVSAVMGAFVSSYIVSRSQARSARAIVPLHPELRTLRWVLPVIAVMLGLVLSPLIMLMLPAHPFAFLLTPGPSALAFGATLILFVLSLGK